MISANPHFPVTIWCLLTHFPCRYFLRKKILHVIFLFFPAGLQKGIFTLEGVQLPYKMPSQDEQDCPASPETWALVLILKFSEIWKYSFLFLYFFFSSRKWRAWIWRRPVFCVLALVPIRQCRGVDSWSLIQREFQSSSFIHSKVDFGSVNSVSPSERQGSQCMSCSSVMKVTDHALCRARSMLPGRTVREGRTPAGIAHIQYAGAFLGIQHALNTHWLPFVSPYAVMV